MVGGGGVSRLRTNGGIADDPALLKEELDETVEEVVEEVLDAEELEEELGSGAGAIAWGATVVSLGKIGPLMKVRGVNRPRVEELLKFVVVLGRTKMLAADVVPGCTRNVPAHSAKKEIVAKIDRLLIMSGERKVTVLYLIHDSRGHVSS